MSNCRCEEKDHKHLPKLCDQPATTADQCCEECVTEITMEEPSSPPLISSTAVEKFCAVITSSVAGQLFL